MSELKVHASACNDEPMVQQEALRIAFAKRLKVALAHAGVAEWGAGRHLADVTGRTPKAASKWINAESMPGRSNMLSIAVALGVRVEWLQYGDGGMLPDSDNQGQESNVIAADFTKKGLRDGELRITQYDLRAAMGSGQLPADYLDVLREITIHRSFFESAGVSYTSASKLAVVTGWGQSMEPTINHGDPIFVDCGVTEFVSDGVYLFTWDNLAYIKRVQKVSKTELKIISDNRNHDPFVVNANEVIFHARAVMVWNGKKL